jgi:methionyl-tRNA formyltransferase
MNGSLVSPGQAELTKLMHIQFLGDRAAHFVPHLEAMGHEISVISKQVQIETCDLCLVSGYRFLVKPPHLFRPRLGIVAFHESDLPQGRGWACLNWTLIEGSPLTVSMFFIDEGMDSGRIIAKKSCAVEALDMVGSLRTKANRLILDLIEEQLPRIERGEVAPLPQDGTPTHWRKRTSQDSELPPGLPLEKLWSHLRVCDNTAYPAFFRLHGKRIVLRYDVCD